MFGQATADLLVDSRSLTPVRIAVHRPFLATSLQVTHGAGAWTSLVAGCWPARAWACHLTTLHAEQVHAGTAARCRAAF